MEEGDKGGLELEADMRDYLPDEGQERKQAKESLDQGEEAAPPTEKNRRREARTAEKNLVRQMVSLRRGNRECAFLLHKSCSQMKGTTPGLYVFRGGWSGGDLAAR